MQHAVAARRFLLFCKNPCVCVRGGGTIVSPLFTPLLNKYINFVFKSCMKLHILFGEKYSQNNESLT